MLSGQRAFRGETPTDTMHAILRADPPELSLGREEIPPAVMRVVRHCLEKSPDERFQSARDLAFDLQAITETSGVSSPPATGKSRRFGLRFPAGRRPPARRFRRGPFRRPHDAPARPTRPISG